jgi:hypothetical protein
MNEVAKKFKVNELVRKFGSKEFLFLRCAAVIIVILVVFLFVRGRADVVEVGRDTSGLPVEVTPVFDSEQEETAPVDALENDPTETISNIQILIKEKTAERDRLVEEYASIQGMLEYLRSENKDPEQIDTYEGLVSKNEQEREQIDKNIVFYEQQIKSLNEA